MYQVRSIWLQEVCDRRLLGSAVASEKCIWIAAVELDRGDDDDDHNQHEQPLEQNAPRDGRAIARGVKHGQ